MENNDEGRRAGAGSHGETFYGTHESENNMVMSEKVNLIFAGVSFLFGQTFLQYGSTLSSTVTISHNKFFVTNASSGTITGWQHLPGI